MPKTTKVTKMTKIVESSRAGGLRRLTLGLVVGLLAALPLCGWAADRPPAEGAVRVLDLAAACRLALENNPSPAAAAARVEAAAERVRQARSRDFPRLDATGRLSRVAMADSDYQVSLAQARLFNPAATVPDPQDYYQAGLTASWTVFDGFERRFALMRARTGAQESAEARNDAVRLLLQAVAQALHGAQLGREAVAIADADVAYNQRLMAEARIRHEVGTGSLSDVLNFEVAANAARAAVIGARQQFQVAVAGLAALLGFDTAQLPGDMVLAALGTEAPPDLVVPAAADQIAYALDHRPDLRQGDRALDGAAADVGQARAGFWPSVSLVATVDGDRANDGHFGANDFGDSVALSVTYNLFAGGYTRARVAEAHQNQKAAQKALESQRLNVTAEVVQALADLAAAAEQLRLQRENEVLVQRHRDLVEKEYEAGQASLVRLNEAQRNLVQAQGRLAQARVSVNQARFALDTATARSLERFEMAQR